MGYAEVYRKRMSKGRRVFRVLAFVTVVGVLLYLAIGLLGSQSGLMVGGTIGK